VVKSKKEGREKPGIESSGRCLLKGSIGKGEDSEEDCCIGNSFDNAYIDWRMSRTGR